MICRIEKRNVRVLYQLVVHSEECHLAGFVQEVGEGDEGVGLLQVQD